MSALEVAAAAVGITDVAIRSIVSLYGFIKHLEEVPKDVERIRTEVAALEKVL